MTDGYTSVRPLYGMWRLFGVKTYMGAEKAETQQRVVFVASDGIWRKQQENRRTEMTRKECLESAAKAVLTDRAREYGHPEDSFALIAALWSRYTGCDISTADVAAMMILLKLARVEGNPRHMDSWVDIAGYAACGAECVEKMYSTPFLKPEELAPQPQTPVPDPVRAGQEIGGSTGEPFGHGIQLRTM